VSFGSHIQLIPFHHAYFNRIEADRFTVFQDSVIYQPFLVIPVSQIEMALRFVFAAKCK
ncbi:uncharacterized protein METZ01_LOCUS54540, partial [marine metagenome]